MREGEREGLREGLRRKNRFLSQKNIGNYGRPLTCQY